MIGIPLGLLYGNAAEWFLHKYLLHGMGKNKSSLWSFHWHDHHKNARQQDNHDVDYTKPMTLYGAPTKEIVALSALGVVHLPLFPIAPFFTATLFYCAANYYRKHKKCHLDVEWGRKNMPWHVDHHMGPNQDANWCVTKPWFDIILGTRQYYLGTEREKIDGERRAERQKRLKSAQVKVLHERKKPRTLKLA